MYSERLFKTAQSEQITCGSKIWCYIFQPIKRKELSHSNPSLPTPTMHQHFLEQITWFFYPENNHISDQNQKMTGECQNQEWKHQIIYKLETQFHNSVNQNTRKCMENSEFDHISPRMIESSSTREAKWRTENLTQQFLDCLRLLGPQPNQL